MANSLINWKKGDYITLGKAISNFNKKIRQIQNEENKMFLPNELNYQEAKESILTRSEFNRLINSLKRFNREGAEEIYTTKAGEQITKWERGELTIQSRIATRRLNQELKQLNEPLESGYSRAQMGSMRVKEIKAQIRNLKSIENKTGYEFRSLKRRIQNIGTSDYTMRKAMIYRENYIREMEKYSHYDNYYKLYNLFSKLTNPNEFYDFMSRNEMTKDLTYQSDQYFTEQAFNSYLQDLGIEIKNDSITYDTTNKKDYKYRLEVNGKVVSQSDSKSSLQKQALDIKGTTQIYIKEN